MILWRRKQKAAEAVARALAAADALAAQDKGMKLNACADDDARYRLCVLWAEQARDSYYQGLRETIADMLLSTDRRYKHMPAEVRTAIGERKWGASLKAKEIIGLEQMYSRWASQYKAGPESRRVA